MLRHLSHRADEIENLQGIVNGTCNFLLARLEQANRVFLKRSRKPKNLDSPRRTPAQTLTVPTPRPNSAFCATERSAHGYLQRK
ncbi:MAG: hypothetical protein GY811_21505 [Myxococcales bacterium]|nr:hypothetical protein [Myxococcales bacterium]